MSESPFIPFYTSDFLGGTSGLTASTKGVYITLLCMMYEAESPLSQSWETLARRCGCTLPAFKKAVETLQDDGKLNVTDAGLWSEKCEKHIAQRCERRDSARSAAEKRWQKSKGKQGDVDATASSAQCKPEPYPYKEEVTNVTSSADAGRNAGFDAFWTIWPSKTAKQAAQKAWRKLAIEDKRKAYAAVKAGWLDDWQARHPDANPLHAATFLNGKRWQDEPATRQLRPIPGGKTHGKRSVTERLAARFEGVDGWTDRDAAEPLFSPGHGRTDRGSGDDRLAADFGGLLTGTNIIRM